MPTFKFDKLVRDNIIDQQIASGAVPHYHILNDKAHTQALIQKIIEEAQEIAQADTSAHVSNMSNIASEIADVQQALDDLKARYGLSDADIATAQNAKNDKNGAFRKGIFIDTVEVAEDNEWVAYYRKNTDRYPEIA